MAGQNPLQIRKLQADWNDLAQIDPLWAISSIPERSHGRWDLQEFMETGRQHIRQMLQIIGDTGLSLPRGRVLDFGCGIGRLTQALAEEFEFCYGVDISPSMIEMAQLFNRFGKRCTYILNPYSDLHIFEGNFFDFVYTYIVLQHMPPELMKQYIREFVRVLKPNGVLMFQVPVQRLCQDEKTIALRRLPRYHPRRVANKVRGILLGHDAATRYYRLRRLGFSKKWLYERFGFRPEIQMHCLAEPEVDQILKSLGTTIMHVVRHQEGQVLSATYVVTKAAHKPVGEAEAVGSINRV
jgi:ubiquinone/menaquinone biosynthesis C-methylase UbiE